MIGIYKITSPKLRVYIGQSINIEKRFNQYKNTQNCNLQTKLYRSFLKYGVDSHVFEIIEECEIEQLNNRERHYQDLYNVLSQKGLNCYLTNSEDKHRILSEEMIEKISNSMTGKVKTEETKEKISNTMKGRKHSEETKQRIAEAMIKKHKERQNNKLK